MTVRDLTERARELVLTTLGEEAEPEVERLLVGDAIVHREGDHYRIESGGDDAIPDPPPDHSTGMCDCGSPLSGFDGIQRCRTCGREYTPAG